MSAVVIFCVALTIHRYSWAPSWFFDSLILFCPLFLQLYHLLSYVRWRYIFNMLHKNSILIIDRLRYICTPNIYIFWISFKSWSIVYWCLPTYLSWLLFRLLFWWNFGYDSEALAIFFYFVFYVVITG